MPDDKPNDYQRRPSGQNPSGHTSSASSSGRGQPAQNGENARHGGAAAHGQGKNTQKTQNWLMVMFTGLIFGVTCVYSYFSWGQWTSTSKALDETRTNRELEYRAYVGAKAAVLVPRTDNPAWAEVVIISTNTGRTPALNGRMRYQIEKRQNPLPEDTKLNQPDVQGGKTVYLSLVDMSTTIGLIGTTVADVLMTTQTNPTTQNAARPTKPPKQAQIVPPPATPSLTPPETLHSFVGWYAYGIIDYTDIFGRPHWTKFYFFNLPGTATWVSCPSFNDTDTQQNKAQDNPN